LICLDLSAQKIDCEFEDFYTFRHKNGKNIFLKEWAESKSFFFFEAGMTIDADGSPRAYHPDDSKALDDLKHAGSEGNWWALVTDNGEKNGNPIIQTEKDPAKGYYVSMTSLNNPNYPITSPLRYADAEKIPYFVLNPLVMEQTGAKVGDFGYVYNEKTGKGSFAIFGDVGNNQKLGEGSIYLAKKLGIESDARIGGQHGKILYIIFPFSGNGRWRSLEEIETETKKRMDKAFAFSFLEQCWKKRPKNLDNKKEKNTLIPENSRDSEQIPEENQVEINHQNIEIEQNTENNEVEISPENKEIEKVED
ncbi:MAG: hypothetical protein EAZ20_02250, partial [Bacteroidetes bacterium]